MLQYEDKERRLEDRPRSSSLFVWMMISRRER